MSARVWEMAILRTLGYNPGEILQLVLGESVLISVLGGIAGIGLGYFSLPADFGCGRLSVSRVEVAGGVAFVITASIAAGTFGFAGAGGDDFPQEYCRLAAFYRVIHGRTDQIQSPEPV